MRQKLFIFGFIAIVTTGVVSQDAGDFGLVYKFQPVPQLSADTEGLLPSTFTTYVSQGIGVHYQVTESLALQSLVLFRHGMFQDRIEIEDVGSYTTDATILTFGAELLAPYYFLHNDAVSVFVAPGATYNSFSYEDKFDSELFYDNEYEARYQEITLLLQLGGQATFNSFAVFSSYGLGVNFITYTRNTAPSISDAPDPETDRTLTGAGIASNQLSIGLIYFVN